MSVYRFDRPGCIIGEACNDNRTGDISRLGPRPSFEHVITERKFFPGINGGQDLHRKIVVRLSLIQTFETKPPYLIAVRSLPDGQGFKTNKANSDGDA